MLGFTSLRSLPSTARLWLYASDRPLTDTEAARVQERMNEFFQSWSSHGRTVLGMAEIAENRVVAVAAHVPEGDISGCGIDKSVHILDTMAAEMKISWTSGLSIAYRDEAGEICLLARPAFRAAVREGTIQADTTVIDLAASEVSRLASPGIELSASDSWHASVFGIPSHPEVA